MVYRVRGFGAAGQALLAIGEQFLILTREEDALGKFRSVYGAAGAQPEACQAFCRRGLAGSSTNWPLTCAAPTRQGR